MKEIGQKCTCYEINFTGDKQNPTSRELIISRGGKKYSITVATTQFLQQLSTYNQPFSPEMKLEDNFYPVAEIPPTVEQLCVQLCSNFESLKPYLTEQKP